MPGYIGRQRICLQAVRARIGPSASPELVVAGGVETLAGTAAQRSDVGECGYGWCGSGQVGPG